MGGTERFSHRGPTAFLLAAGMIAVALFCWEMFAQRERREERQEEKDARQKARIDNLAAEAAPQSEELHNPFRLLLDGKSTTPAPAGSSPTQPPPKETVERQADGDPRGGHGGITIPVGALKRLADGAKHFKVSLRKARPAPPSSDNGGDPMK